MNERSEYRNQNAEAPTTSAFDAPQVPPGIAPAANDEGASAGVISHNAPRQLNPMGKAIAVVLVLLLGKLISDAVLWPAISTATI